MPDESTLKERLATAADRARQRSISVRPVCQTVLRLAGNDPRASFVEARRQVLLWIAKRAGHRLPESAWDGEPFDLHQVGAQRSAAVAIEDPPYWAARLDDADKDVAQRTWSTEIGLGVNAKSETIFGCRLYCVSRGEDVPFIPHVPGVVRQIVENVGATLDGRLLSLDPWLVTDEDSVDELVDVICSPARKCNVFVFSLPEGDQNIEHTVMPVAPFHRATLGGAHCAILTGPASLSLTDRLGKEFSVFHQGIRTYRPGFDPDLDGPYDHPLALPQKVRGWPKDVGGFERLLINEALKRAVTGTDLERQLPSFATVQRIALEARRERAKSEGASQDELLDLALGEVAAVKTAAKQQLEEVGSLLSAVDEERIRAEQDRDEAKSEILGLRARVTALEHALVERGTPIKPPVIPDAFADLDEWSRANLAGSVYVHKRALREAKKSLFENPPLAYRALLLLRDYYVPMRRSGGLDRKRAYENACRELGLEESPSFAGARAGEEGDEYFVTYEHRRRMLDRHLKGSNVRNERFGFRLYFFWDEESQQVVVGWLPSHLSTRMT